MCEKAVGSNSRPFTTPLAVACKSPTLTSFTENRRTPKLWADCRQVAGRERTAGFSKLVISDR
jgi:hypothetical protein